MLKVVVALLVLANAAFFAWEQGYLGDPTSASRQDREPERLAQQIRPQDIRLLNAPATQEATPPQTDSKADPSSESVVSPPTAPAQAPLVPDASTSSSAPASSCWVASGFTPAQAQALEQALATLPELRGRWQVSEVRTGGRWVVFMGRYDDAQMARKKGELRTLKVDFREVTVPTVGKGLALGTFTSEESAAQALRDLGRKGVRSARVTLERPEGLSHTLTLPDITEAQRAQVAPLGAALGGKRLQPCGG
jgi:hypothetical protein